MKVLLLFVLFASGCATVPHPTFYKATYSSHMEDLYEIKISASGAYCQKKDSNGWPVGYDDSCHHGERKIFRDYSEAVIDGGDLVKKMCGGSPKLVGSKENKEYAGTTRRSCSTNYYKYLGSSSTYCSGGEAKYSYSRSVFFRCGKRLPTSLRKR